MKLFWITLFAAVTTTNIATAQITEEEVREMVATAPEDQLVVESSRMLQDDYYYLSEIVVDKLLTIKPESSNYNYRKGFILLGSHQDYIKALPYFEKAIKQINKNYDMYSARENAAPSDAYYHMARCYHLNEQIEKAEEYYTKFIAESLKKSELLASAKLGLIQCKVAREAIDHPKKAIVKNVGSVVNTVEPEYSPVISLDGKSLYFTSRRPWADHSSDEYRDPKFNNYPEDIYVSVNNGSGGWTKPERLLFCSPDVNEATIAVSSDERKVYAYQDITGAGDLYYSDFNTNKFQTLEQVDYDGVNTKYWETHCTVTPDGNNMYFVSDRPGGFGGRDIYRIVKFPNGTWSEPMNLGPNINTANDEESPFISVDNKTMYFASNGPTSMGGFDIFISIRDDNNVWSDPVNLGYPINRTGDDLFYTSTIDGLRGYLSSFRPEGYGEKDIYEIQNDYLGTKNAVVINGAIHDVNGNDLSEESHVKLRCTSCLSSPENQTQIISVRLRDGAFISSLTACREYEIIFMKDSTTEIRRESFATDCAKGFEQISKNAYYGEYKLSAFISDKASGAAIANAKVDIIEKGTNKVVESLISNSEGMVYSSLLKGKVYDDEFAYNFKVVSDRYLSKNQEYSGKLADKAEFKTTLLLDKIDIGTDVGKVINIEPIYFDLNKSNIRPDAQLELDKIVQLLNENPTLEIELGSHTDCRSSKAYNLKLSDARAKSSAEYIRSRISNPKRINGKGYGESQLINGCECEGKVVSNCSEEEHQANRRTEFKVVKL